MPKQKSLPQVTELYGGEVLLSFDAKKHRYIVTDNGNVFEAPSVTTCLGIIDKSGALTQWAANQTIEYLRGEILPFHQYTQEALEEKFKLARFNFRRTKQKALDVGTIVHRWIEDYLTDMLLVEAGDAPYMSPPPFPENEQALSSCKAAEKWLEETKFRPITTEEKIYSRKYQYAGTIDHPAYIDGRLSVLDWKTSKAHYQEYFLQTSAYAQAYSEMHSCDIPDQWVIRLDKETGEFDPKQAKIGGHKTRFASFLAAKDLYLGMEELKKEQEKDWIGNL